MPVLLAAAMLAAAALLLSLALELTFFQDSWEFLMNRRDFTADAFLQPHNEHIVVIPVGIELVLLRLFGMSSELSGQVVLTISLLVTAFLLFVYVGRRIGPWPALMAAVLMLFLGPAWQDLLWPFQIGFVGSVASGVAMLLALERDDRRGDVAACAFLAISIGFSSLGLAFAVGAAVDVLQRWRRRGLRRAYVAAVPLLLYAAWYAGWGHEAADHLSLANVLSSPLFVLEGLAASLDSLAGLGSFSGQSAWGPTLLVALVVAIVFAQVRKPGFDPRLWPAAASAAAFWFLAAFNFFPGREASSSRYLYAGAAFVLLIAANLLSGVRIPRRALVAAGVLTALAAASNVVTLREGRDWLESQTVLTRANLAAIEISERTVERSFGLTPEIAGTPFLIDVLAGEYLTAVDEYGSPAYEPAALANAPEAGRVQADVVLANALPVTMETVTGTGTGATSRGRCTSVPGGAGEATPELPLRPGLTRIVLGPGEPGTIRLRRFASAEYPLVTEGVAGGTTTLLRIPRDAGPRPWRLQVEAVQGARACR